MTRRCMMVSWASAMAIACGSDAPADGGGDPCVDQPTTAIQVIDAITRLRAYPGEVLTIGYRIDTRDRDGVLVAGEGEVVVEGSGELVASAPGTVQWRAGMAHGTFDVRIGRKGCAADFILEKLEVIGPDLDAVRSEPSGSPGATAVAWSPDSEHFVVASSDLLRVYDRAGTFVRGVKTGILPQVQQVAWSPDGAWIAVAGADGKDMGPVLLEAKRLTPWTRFPTDVGYGVAFDPASRALYSLAVVHHPSGGVLSAWLERLDLETGRSMALFGAGASGPPAYAVTVDEQAIYTGAIGQKRDNHVVFRMFGCDDELEAREVAPHPASGLVYVRTASYVCAVNPATGGQSEVLFAPMDRTWAMALDPLDEGLVLTGKGCDSNEATCGLRSVVVFRGDLGDIESLELSTLQRGGERHDAAWSPDGSLVVVTSSSGLGFDVIERDALWGYWGDPLSR